MEKNCKNTLFEIAAQIAAYCNEVDKNLVKEKNIDNGKSIKPQTK